MSAMPARRAKIIPFPTRPPAGSRPPEAGGRSAGARKTGDEQGLVEVRCCRDQAEALVVRGLLESEGIRVVLQSRQAHSVYPFSVGDQAEVRLLVAEADLPRARGVLAREV
jgi:hypothetical protein